MKNTKNEETLIYVSPELGNYDVLVSKHFTWAKGEALEVSCPYCKRSLLLSPGSTRAKILFKDNDGIKQVIFSTIIGERLTYVIEKGGVVSYGKDAHDERDVWEKIRPIDEKNITCDGCTLQLGMLAAFFCMVFGGIFFIWGKVLYNMWNIGKMLSF